LPGDFLLIDGGNICSFNKSDYEIDKYVFLGKQLDELGYFAVGMGELDLALDPDDLNRLLRETKFHMIASNVNKRSDKDLWEEYVIKKIGGLKVGIFSELRSTLLRKESAIDPDYMGNAREMVKKLRRKGADLVICIAHVDDRNAKALADSVDGIDVVLGGKVAGPLFSEYKVPGKDTWYINPGDRARHVGLMQLHLNRDKKIDSTHVFVKPLPTSYAEDPEMKARVDAFKKIYDEKRGKSAVKRASSMNKSGGNSSSKIPAQLSAIKKPGNQKSQSTPSLKSEKGKITPQKANLSKEEKEKMISRIREKMKNKQPEAQKNNKGGK